MLMLLAPALLYVTYVEKAAEHSFERKRRQTDVDEVTGKGGFVRQLARASLRWRPLLSPFLF